MTNDPLGTCAFDTERLRVRPWHGAESGEAAALPEVIAELLTEATTAELPDGWRGSYTPARARAWIESRDAESPTLLVTELDSGRPIGLVIVVGLPNDDASLDVRLGYLLAEDSWGRGFATELVAGLVGWARTQPLVQTLTGGVSPTNRGSIRVLEKNGFVRVDDGSTPEWTYRHEVERADEWDEFASSWDDDPHARAYAAAAFGSLRSLVAECGLSLDGARVIDFGCGTGLLTERMVEVGAAVDAVDTSRAMLEVVDRKVIDHGWTNVHTAVAPPEATERHDLIVCSSVCAFLDDYPSTVRSLVACLRPGGLFVQWDWERELGEPDGLDRDEIRAALTGAGLHDVSVGVGFTLRVGDDEMAPLMGHGRRP